MPISELRERMREDDVQFYRVWERLYGLPDAYFTAGTLGPAVANSLAGGKLKSSDFVPYFAADLASGEYEQDPDEIREIMAAKKRAVSRRNPVPTEDDG